jgi:hypothetical protein
MTQEVFPEIHAATQALEQRISLTESEIGQMKEAITEKKRLIKGWKKAIAAVIPKPPGQKKTAVA